MSGVGDEGVGDEGAGDRMLTAPATPARDRLRTARLVYIAPEGGSSGVGDYATDFLEAVRPHLGSVVEVRHRGAGALSLRELREHRSTLRRMLAEPDSPATIIHVEQSGGGLLPFWGPYRLRAAVSTATVHDPPLGVWFPLRTRLLARHRLLGHAVNFPLSLVGGALESRVNAGRELFALTRAGTAALAGVMRRSVVRTSSLFIPDRPQLPAVVDRPLAVGLFGYVYRGKGFDSVRALRERLDDDIVIRIAGRGTEKLARMPGVEILGEVNGEAEDAFFASIRMLVVPYVARTVYFREAIPAASTISRAIAYQTPVLSTAQGALRELRDDGGAVVVDGDVEELAAAGNRVVRDTALLERLELETSGLRRARSAQLVIEDYLRVWEAHT